MLEEHKEQEIERNKENISEKERTTLDKKEVGERIRAARIKKGLTQIQFGDAIGVTNKAVSRWERGVSHT